jgi:hypothetical protein
MSSSFRAVFYWNRNEIWYVLISERLVYAFFYFHFWSQDLWVGRLDRWPSCYSADSFGDAKVQFVIWTKIFHKQYGSKHWWISLTLMIVVHAKKLQYCAVYSPTTWNSSFRAVFWRKVIIYLQKTGKHLSVMNNENVDKKLNGN